MPTTTSNGSAPSRKRARADATVPAFIVHSLAHAVAAAQAAADADRPIVLLSASDAGIYAGAGWFSALVEAVRAAAPGAKFQAVLDCGDDAGAAMAAIRAGVEAIVFTGRSDIAARLLDIAKTQDCRLLTERPPAARDLDRLFFADSETLRRHCSDHLA